MENLAFVFIVVIWLFHEDINTYTLHNIKHILIFGAIKSGFFLAAVAVQVKNVDFIESSHQFFAHLAVDDAIEEGVVADECQYTFTSLADKLLPKSDKLNVVVRQRLNIALVEILFVVVEEA